MSKSDSTQPNAAEPHSPGTVVECHELIRQLQVNHVQVMQRLSELEERLKLNSRNSSKPPSSDGPGTPPCAPRPKNGKRLGGQPGHPGSFRAMVPVEQTQVQVACPASEHCERCGADAQGDPDKPIRHQVFELPQIEPLITEYVRLRGVCSGCGLKHHGALPVGVPTGQLGPRALALVGTLAGQFHLTQRKVQAVLSHIMGIRFSLGAVSQAHGLVAQGLAKPVAQLAHPVAICPCVPCAREAPPKPWSNAVGLGTGQRLGGQVHHRSLAWAGGSQVGVGRAAQLCHCE